mmetsp:Transcript_3310/g.9511  ORF Transcript_3310/g.9511 Transcript_3310/m.9511 type:complete len:94 (+) Transcript_3310:4035-4316(+)
MPPKPNRQNPYDTSMTHTTSATPSSIRARGMLCHLGGSSDWSAPLLPRRQRGDTHGDDREGDRDGRDVVDDGDDDKRPLSPSLSDTSSCGLSD